MKNIRMSLINTDFSVRASADIKLDDDQNRRFAQFMESVESELITGATAFLEIEGPGAKPVKLMVAES